MYRFARCQTHSKCPDLQGWYLILKPEDVNTLMELHKGIANFYYRKFGMDPHLMESEMAMAYNPIILTAKWLRSIENFLLEGVTLAINQTGGMMPLDSVKVLATVESEKMIWPTRYEDEVITISRWSEGRHFYLSSNKDRVFMPSKYVEYKAAHCAVKKYTDNIKTKGC